MKDILTKNHLPLKIIHEIKKPEESTFEEKCAEITKGLKNLVSLGFGGVVTNVHWGDDYLNNEEDWALLKFALDEADRLGMRAWIYDEHGYPSGNARGLTLAANPDYECRAVANIEQRIKEAARLGFTKAIIPYRNVEKRKIDCGIELIPIKSIYEPLKYLRAQNKIEG